MKSGCSVSCGGGIQSVTRTCTNPPPNEIGKSCVGESYYEEACNGNSCLHDDKSLCKNRVLNWTCPGGYLHVNSARWKTSTACGNYSTFKEHTITPHMQNKCENKTTCSFTIKDSSSTRQSLTNFII